MCMIRNIISWGLLIFFNENTNFLSFLITLGRWQSKTLLAIDERGSNIARNSVFDCHLSPIGRQMAIENSVSNDFYLRSSIVLKFSIAAFLVC